MIELYSDKKQRKSDKVMRIEAVANRGKKNPEYVRMGTFKLERLLTDVYDRQKDVHRYR